MSLAAGSRLGSYIIEAPLGAGGMGEVYRARDTKLNRDVAIKVLPEIFAHDHERLARFTREAQTLASLNHPNIAHIHGLEESSGARALVMELVDGEDLSTQIARGPVPLAEALSIARQVADALEAAHEHGIIHRDLKPANIKVRADGTVKVLDFGLAKALDPAGTSVTDAMDSPTLTVRATQMGMILGTAAYMAPEQARGKAVDRRADIWAFGIVLYEMLTGRRAFEGDEISDVLAAVLRQDIDWTPLPAGTPPSVRRLLRRCLEKDPRKRLSAIGDARLELDEPEPASPVSAPNDVHPRSSWLSYLWPALAGMAVTAGIAAWLWPSSRGANIGVTRVSILPAPGVAMYPDSTAAVISPDGRTVAFVVGSPGQIDSQLWVRSLDSTSSRRLEDADGASVPFWSPDSRRIGFFTSTKLKTIAASGGRAEVLCDAPAGRGGAWSPSNVIVYAPDAVGPLYRIAASGGTLSPVTSLDAAHKDLGHRFPTFLPDGRHFLYAALPARNGAVKIFAASLDGGSATLVGSMESAPTYADPGWLLFTRQGVLTAQKFDPNRLALTGDLVSLGDEPTVITDTSNSFTAGRVTSVSSSGSLAYYSAPSNNTTAIWLDSSGKTTGALNLPPGHYDTVSVAPDGGHAVLVRSTSASESTLWLLDLLRGNASPLTSGHGRTDLPVWSPDGTRVVFAADRDGPYDLFVKSVDDGLAEQPVYRSDAVFKAPGAWSPDSKWIVVTELDAGTSHDLWLLSVSSPSKLTLFFRGPQTDFAGPVSPDGHALAYFSDDTGRRELYVQSFPVPGRKVQVSESGAGYAWWTRDGRQLVFLGTDLRSLWRVEVEPGATFKAARPRQITTFPAGIIWIDAMPDRQRFLALVPAATGTGSITVVQHWAAALEQPR